MTNSPLSMLAAVIAMATIASCSSGWLPSNTAQPSPEALSISSNLHQTINQYRLKHQRCSIERHSGLDEIALDHTRYLLKRRGSSIIHGRNVTHIGSGWRSVAAHRRHNMTHYGENVAAITTEPEAPCDHLLLMWKTSYQHNETMLGNWTHTGIGTLIDDDGSVFVTQVFGLKKNEGSEADEVNTDHKADNKQ